MFTVNAWMGYLCFIMLQCVILTIVLRAANVLDKQSYVRSVNHGIGLIFKSAIQQGNYVRGCQLSYQMFHLTANLFSLLMFVCYTALLTSYMTSRGEQTKIRTFQDIYDQKLPLYVVKHSSYHHMLSQAQEGSAANKIYQEQILRNPDRLIPADPTAYDELFDRIPEAVCLDIANVKFNTKVPALYESLENTFEDTTYDHIAPAMQKNSEYFGLFNYHLNQIRESGVMRKLELKWFNNTEFKWNQGYSNLEQAFAIGFHEVFTLVIILFTGIIVAIVTVVFETINCKN